MSGDAFPQQLRDELAPLPDAVRARMFELMRQAAEARITQQQLAAIERADHARRLLDQGVDRTATCLRLVARFNVSTRTAYRAIGQALRDRTPNLCQESGVSGTAAGQSAPHPDQPTDP